MKIIKTNKAEDILVDDDLFPFLNRFNWWLDDKGYAIASVCGRKVKMHSLILSAGDNSLTDHKNGNRTDNQLDNLRPATRTTNAQNTTMHKDNKSGYKGVHWVKARKKWCAKIRAFGVDYNLGYFNEVKDAARAYNKACIRLHGEYAKVVPIDD